jgi:large subunit ribosomal protein L3
MVATKSPRRGSMQFWPRKRANKQMPRIRSWPQSSDAKPLAFAGYKVGMTQVGFVDNRKTSLTKGQQRTMPGTIIECPPIVVASARFYKNTADGEKLVTEVAAQKLPKEVSKRLTLPKKKDATFDAAVEKDYDFIRLILATQPKMTGFGKKVSDLFEVAVGGPKDDQLAYAKEKIGAEILLSDIFGEGDLVDVHAVTKGKGFQGPLKRFGLALRHHKSEKTKRGPGSISGGWNAQGKMMYRVAHAGKMGYHTRTEYNKAIIKIGTEGSDVNPNGGFVNYGQVRGNYLILKGSVAGSKKRPITLTAPIRPNKDRIEKPDITYISKKSQQGN